MEVLDRYLQAVRYWLPKGRHDDIVAELSEDLRSQLDDREAELGRSLDEAEAEALLKGRGHPMWVAQGYAPPQHLIGPMVLPIYRQVVKIGLASLAAIFVTLYVVFRFVVETPPLLSLRSAEFWIWQACLYGFALVGLYTVIFAGIERGHGRARATDVWDPRDPKALPRAPGAAEAERSRSLRVDAAGELAGSTLFVLWWLGVLRLPATPGLEVTLGPVWQSLYGPILAVALADIALAVVDLVRPRRSRLVTGLSFARHACGVALAALLLAAGQWVAVAVPGAPAERIVGFAYWVNLSVAATVGVVGVFYLVQGVRDAFALFRTSSGGSPR